MATDPASGAQPKGSALDSFLTTIERVGNKVPHPAIIFVGLAITVVVLSAIFEMMGTSVTYESINAESRQLEEVTTSAQSLLTTDGIRFMYENVVKNFMDFNAVGVIIVAMLGVGVAESAGLVGALWLQFARAVERDSRFRQCAECGTWFELARGTARADKLYCSTPCRTKAYRKRQAEAARRHGEGQSIEEIARALESDFDTVRGWIKRKAPSDGSGGPPQSGAG